MIQRQSMRLGGLSPIAMEIRYVETDEKSRFNVFDSHAHEGCEIYLNLSGDVSFVVENHVYPIRPGSAILTRPHEFHHCIYNSNEALHRHFWLLFSCEGNEVLLHRFFARQAGCENLADLSPEGLKRGKEICFRLLEENCPPLERTALFFQLLLLLDQGEFPSRDRARDLLYPDVKIALDYIYENLSYSFSMAAVAEAAHVSLNTLERHFFSSFGLSPSQFLTQRRLSRAQEMLKQGASVNEACQACGFSDCSYFIILFKKHFGCTPLQFKKKQ